MKLENLYQTNEMITIAIFHLKTLIICLQVIDKLNIDEIILLLLYSMKSPDLTPVIVAIKGSEEWANGFLANFLPVKKLRHLLSRYFSFTSPSKR